LILNQIKLNSAHLSPRRGVLAADRTPHLSGIVAPVPVDCPVRLSGAPVQAHVRADSQRQVPGGPATDQLRAPGAAVSRSCPKSLKPSDPRLSFFTASFLCL